MLKTFLRVETLFLAQMFQYIVAQIEGGILKEKNSANVLIFIQTHPLWAVPKIEKILILALS